MKIAGATTALVHDLRLILLCTLVLTMGGCSRMSESWKEEVRLSDGRLIVVKRTAKGTITRDIAMRATGWKPKETTLRIAQVEGATKPPVWRSFLIPVVMDYDPASSTWSVVATYMWCSTWYDMGRPSSPYVQYISVGGESWRVVPLQPGWVGRRANLLTHIRPTGESGLVREQYKEMHWRTSSEQYKSISTSWKTSC
ncbi:hypothetical protein [Stenotrophomonas sp. SORGH_AS_0282]|uniref:hypothetical protein n=1 Tax=Stenotrophomonas TaxID=40323 RepID=UPI0027813193|nr:hypothetical protein [Stenotrophomonas sp. SORGH_AS_0282]MDQ1062664.1 hypothetical protein [Stenotrophomonas sp. SORGH_AS_0282]MDQ1188981.1 hypothetical protein [Stenotrophomonas sp. SORGH_AS_0282]